METETNLEKLPDNVYFLEQQREEFATFMATCRGPSEASDEDKTDAVTLACTRAWQDKLAAETESIWQTLARSVPPGILLLFLLATLGGLYRYNMRLAGFHHSRADALELMIVNKVKFDAHTLTTISDALAADKVEFGRSKTPADQAVEMFKAVMARTR